MDLKPFLLFDFDGTICDSIGEAYRILNDLADVYHYRKLKDSERRELKKKTSREILRELGIPLVKLPRILPRVRRELNKNIGQLTPVSGVKKGLCTLHERGFGMGILSSNSEINIREFLNTNGLNVFQFVYSGSSLFGKARMLRRLLVERELKKESVIYVGDETRDIEAAKKCGIKVVAVSWGVNEHDVLEAQCPDYVVDTPSELMGIFEGNYE